MAVGHLETQEAALVPEFQRRTVGALGGLQLGRDLVKCRIGSLGESTFEFNFVV